LSLITFIVPIGDVGVYQNCFLSSPLFREKSNFQILGQTGFKNAGQAFNDGIDKAANDLIVCAHQDVVFPVAWVKRFLTKLQELESQGVPLGIVGCAGITSKGEPAGHIYRHDREFCAPHALPAKVETLDEMLISFRKSSGLRFDPQLPSFWGYSTDLCLQAHLKGLQNFALDVPCFHQAKNRERLLPRDFFTNWNYLCEKWSEALPVHTLTGTVAHKRSFWMDRVKQAVSDAIGYNPEPWWKDLPRIDPQAVLFADLDQSEEHDPATRLQV